MSGYFLAGTDTGVGKTLIACALLHALAATGKKCIGMKPVAAGLDASGRNEDVDALLAASNVQSIRELINPYALKRPIAPHLAAAEEGIVIRFAPIHRAFAQLAAMADVVVVEGVGGFCVPLGPEGDSADLVQTLALPVILVVGMRLGCINHALLTREAILARGLAIAGWVANMIDPNMAAAAENVSALETLLDAPLLGVVPFQATIGALAAAAFLSVPDPAHELACGKGIH